MASATTITASIHVGDEDVAYRSNGTTRWVEVGPHQARIVLFPDSAEAARALADAFEDLADDMEDDEAEAPAPMPAAEPFWPGIPRDDEPLVDRHENGYELDADGRPITTYQEPVVSEPEPWLDVEFLGDGEASDV
jgi:hypothetical protein